MSRVLLVSAIALSILALVGGVSSEDKGTVNELDAAIRRELRPGTTRSTVISFLQNRKIPYHDSKDITYFRGPRTVWGLLTRSARDRILVIDTILTFEFDGEDKLTSYSRREQVVGP